MNNFILRFIPDALRGDHDEFRRARLIIGISLIFDAFALYYMFQYFSMKLMITGAALGIAVVLSMSVPFVLRSTGSLNVAGNFMCVMLLMTFSTIVIFEGGPVSYSKYWFGTIPMVAMLFNGLVSGRNWVITLIVWNILIFLGARLEIVHYPNTLLSMTLAQQLTKGLVSVIGIVSVGYFIIRLYETEKNRTLLEIHTLRDDSVARAKADYEQLAALKAENERIAAENVRRLERQREYLASNVEHILRATNSLAQGDLTMRLTPERDDEIKLVFEGFNNSVENVRQMLERVVESIRETLDSVEQISSATEQISTGLKTQSTEVMQVAGSVEEMSITIGESTSRITLAAHEASQANDDAARSERIMHNMIQNVEKLSNVVLQSAEKITLLGVSSEKIGEIVLVIDEIADQTNLLALNAAIEAARAGDSGRGFAVVADEVRKLAERTQKATKEISSMIGTIQRDTTEVVSTMTEGRGLVAEGQKLVGETSDALTQILNRTNKVSDVMSQVAAASEEESATSAEMARSMSAISSVVKESTRGIQTIAQSIEALLQQTEDLDQLTRQFILSSAQGQEKRFVALPARPLPQ
ncbi:MAG: HAMP domain-containing protein [Candidatus Kapabacteria bacterium]|nr:HAMP domain-containing protein [Candidatus Kapabacteria bacterium]